MVLVAAAVCTREGNSIISFRFAVELSAVQINDLLAAFPKLITSLKRITMIETETFRYMYEPKEKFIMLLITTVESNIRKDLETLQLCSELIPEFCPNMDRKEILEHERRIIFGLKKSFIFGEGKFIFSPHMDENLRVGSDSPSFVFRSEDIGSNEISNPSTSMDIASNPTKSKQSVPSPNKSVNPFVDLFKTKLGKKMSTLSIAATVQPKVDLQMNDVHLRFNEKMSIRLDRDGCLQLFKLSGLLTIRIADKKYGRIKVQIENNDPKRIQLQTHPNVDKQLFQIRHQIGLKKGAKPYPINMDVAVVKWHFQTEDESAIPFKVNCWPSDNGKGGCYVNIEFELTHQRLELLDVSITIPLPINSIPSVSECDGDAIHDPCYNILKWNLPVIDSKNKSGSMEFAVPVSKPGDFYPINVVFTSKIPYAEIKAGQILSVDDAPIKYSSDTVCYPDKYEIV